MNPDDEIKSAIDAYLSGRKALLQLGRTYPDRIGGNDNIIGRIGEFLALRFLEYQGRKPRKVEGSSNPGFDLVCEDGITVQVKVITTENKRGKTVRLVKPWDQFLLIELDDDYTPERIGVLTEYEHTSAQQENNGRSGTPIVSRGMLTAKGLIGRYGTVYQKHEIDI